MPLLSRLLVVFLVTAAPIVVAQPDIPRYSEVRIVLSDRSDLQELARRVPGLGHVHVEKEGGQYAAVTVLDERALDRLRSSGFVFTVEVPDLAAAYAARPSATDADRAAGLAESRVGGFGYGSMGGYYTFEEVVSKLDELAAQYPNLITERVSIGQSWEGRELWMVKISDNPSVDEAEPEVLYTSLHHAREPQSMATVLYTMIYLLEHYGSDPDVTYLVDNRELYFVPVLNPDGYVFNETTNPEGGGLWRKNRRDNGGNVFGVDLNRNYAYEWGRDNIGSSPDPDAATYRGPSPFSEPETAALRDFVIGRDFRSAFNYHSYSNLLLHPWGYEEETYTPDHDLFTDISAVMTSANGYVFGQVADVLYRANGGSDDWFYGEQDDKEKVFSWTPEVGSLEDGFWPEVERIIPLADENLEANLTLAWFAGENPTATAVTVTDAPGGFLDPGETGTVSVTMQNLGLEDVGEARIRVVSTDDEFPLAPSAFSPPFALAAEESVEVAGLTITLGAEAPLGLQDGLGVEVEFDGTSRIVPLRRFLVGTPVALLEDDASTTDAWTLGDGWGLSADNTSPPTSFADSPGGDYGDDAATALTLATPLDLSTSASARLRFRATWAIEAFYDFVQVRASTDGIAWTPLEGAFTDAGSGLGAQPDGEPGYDGTQPDWVEEQVDLRAFAGESTVYLQFILFSDEFVEEDGFFVDDIIVEGFINGGAVSDEPVAQPGRLHLHAAYPNPFETSTRLSFETASAGRVTLDVYDVLGRHVRTLTDAERTVGRHTAMWDGRDASGATVASGVYLAVLRAPTGTAVRRLLVLR